MYKKRTRGDDANGLEPYRDLICEIAQLLSNAPVDVPHYGIVFFAAAIEHQTVWKRIRLTNVHQNAENYTAWTTDLYHSI